MSYTVSKNPYTGKEVKTFKNHTSQEVLDSIDLADKRFYSWRETSFSQRKKLMLSVASELRSNKVNYAETMTLEMGKPIFQAIAEVEKCRSEEHTSELQ